MINITIDDREINKARLWVAQINNQLPFATSVALNNTAFEVRKAMSAQTMQSFNGPTAFTKNAFRYNKSSKTSLVAQVYAEPNRRYFPTQIKGGSRLPKPYEGFLAGIGAGQLAGRLVPTRHVLNKAGNPRKNVFGQIQQKLSTTDQGGFFIGTPRGGGRAPGVYRRSRGQLFAYFVEASQPSYEPRFPMERVGNQTVARVFPSQLNRALENAIRTMK